jgi:hypothetical protein
MRVSVEIPVEPEAMSIARDVVARTMVKLDSSSGTEFYLAVVALLIYLIYAATICASMPVRPESVPVVLPST